ncbi:MAG: FAD-binding oxidoreductase [Rhizobiales bacterium]|nr:FAD-binding oxidoreductase [Hyphomicrobiales bacterium]
MPKKQAPRPHRRDVLRALLAASAGSVIAGTLGSSVINQSAQAASTQPLPTLSVLPSGNLQIIESINQDAAYYAQGFQFHLQKLPKFRYLCRSHAHVEQAFADIQARGLRFAVRSGGHCFAGHSQSDSAVIDLRELNHIEFDGDGIHVRVGAGVQLVDLHLEAAQRNLVVAAGWCPSVGVGGHCLGGGVGYAARAYGLLCDQLVSAQVIDGMGNALTASSSENPDLFWALKGGGGSIALVSEFTFVLAPIAPSPQQATSFELAVKLPFEQAVEFFAQWQTWAHQTDPRLTSQCNVIPYPGKNVFFVINGQMLAGAADFLAQFKTFPLGIAHLEPSKVFIGSLRAILEEHILKDPGHYFPTKYQSAFCAAPMESSACRVLLGQLTDLPLGSVNLMFEALGGAAATPTIDDTAYPHRDAAFLVQFASSITEKQDNTAAHAALSSIQQALRPFVTGGAYVNYRDPDLRDFAQAYWGDNYPRLQAVKAKYDPQNMFRHAQSIALP